MSCACEPGTGYVGGCCGDRYEHPCSGFYADGTRCQDAPLEGEEFCLGHLAAICETDGCGAFIGAIGRDGAPTTTTTDQRKDIR